VFEVAIVGVGAIGGIIAAHLCASGEHSVTACVRTPFDRIEVVFPEGTVIAEPAQLVSPEHVVPSEFVIVATKAHDTAGAAAWLDALCRPETCVGVLQNGVEHVERVAPYVNGATVVPVVVDCPAHRTAPGRVVMRGPLMLVLPFAGDEAGLVEMFMRGGIPMSGHRDFTTVLWKKLCLNVTGAIPALENRTTEVFHDPAIGTLAHDLILECVAVGRAEGAKIEASIAAEIVAGLQQAPPGTATSMLQDRRAGRPLEVDARNGAVVRFGEKHGIATPANRDILRRAAALRADA
jgi:2-dehydropantoate 2-reductase